VAKENEAIILDSAVREIAAEFIDEMETYAPRYNFDHNDIPSKAFMEHVVRTLLRRGVIKERFN
jgi:hypothetical protein